MTLAELRDRYIPQVPFTSTELSDSILQTAFNNSVIYYSQYDPIMDLEYISTLSTQYDFPEPGAPDYIFRAYGGVLEVADIGPNSITSEWHYIKPTLYIYPNTYYLRTGYKHKLDDVDLDNYPYLDRYVRTEIIMGASNRRRMANLNELPIDFKGDDFYREALEEQNALKEKIEEIVMKIDL